MKRLILLIVAGFVSACAPTFQHAGKPEVGFSGPRLDDNRPPPAG